MKRLDDSHSAQFWFPSLSLAFRKRNISSKLYVDFRLLPASATFGAQCSLRFRITLHWRQAEWLDHKLSPAQGKRQVIPHSCHTTATPAALVEDGDPVHPQHTLWPFFRRCRRPRRGQLAVRIHEVRKRLEFQNTVTQEFCPSDQSGAARIEFQWEGKHGRQSVRVFPKQRPQCMKELEQEGRVA